MNSLEIYIFFCSCFVLNVKPRTFMDKVKCSTTEVHRRPGNFPFLMRQREFRTNLVLSYFSVVEIETQRTKETSQK